MGKAGVWHYEPFQTGYDRTNSFHTGTSDPVSLFFFHPTPFAPSFSRTLYLIRAAALSVAFSLSPGYQSSFSSSSKLYLRHSCINKCSYCGNEGEGNNNCEVSLESQASTSLSLSPSLRLFSSIVFSVLLLHPLFSILNIYMSYSHSGSHLLVIPTFHLSFSSGIHMFSLLKSQMSSYGAPVD